MSETSSNNRRIAKNTLMLYIRMGFVMLAQLYAARIVLDVLGASNYGIYNVVGGIVIMFSFLSRTLASASQRFFAFELGRKDYNRLNNVFNINLLLFCIILGVIILLAETVGVWFMHTQLTIPKERMLAASWVYQFSVFSFSATLLAIPYQATIIAREKMDVYAYIGILEATLNLCFVLLLQHLHWDVDLLIAYGALMFFLHLITNGSYVIIARRRYRETRYQFYWDTKLAKEVISYSSWNLFGTAAGIIRSQGINILINMFFNPAINAARGLAYQINTALNQFSHNFFTAVRPQVTKYYAQNDREAALSLVFSSARLTFYLMQFLAVPVMVYAHEVLDFWLVDIPLHTELFMVLVICVALIDSISNPLMTLAQATGRVKLYQSVVGGLIILNLPISLFFLKAGYGAEYTMYVAIAIAALSLLMRLFILRKLVTFPILSFCRKVLGRILVTFLCALVLTRLVKMCIYEPFAGKWMLCLSIAISIVINVCVIATIGLSKAERITTVNILKQKIK